MNDNLLKKLEKIYKVSRTREAIVRSCGNCRHRTLYGIHPREHGSLSKMVNKYLQLTETHTRKQEAEGILALGDADKNYPNAKDELGELERQEEALFDEIKGLFISEDRTSGKNVIAEIRAGTGGSGQPYLPQTCFACIRSIRRVRDGK